jgi:tRNA A37 threonylcarbamoyltransferase TsaD
MEVAKHHKEIADSLYESALNQANIKEKDIEIIAISNAPGLAPCLLEGMKFSKKIALVKPRG